MGRKVAKTARDGRKQAEEALRESKERYPSACPLRTIADLGPGDHLCCLYEMEEEHRDLLTPFLRDGLERGEKVIYIVDAHTSETVLGYLRDDGLEVELHLASGQLSVLTAYDSYMRDGIFSPDGMIALLRAETERALTEGYAALRVTGEMTWALRGLPGAERLIEYETKLNDFFPGSKCLAICQYDQRRFDPAVLLDVLRTHPIAVVGKVVYDNFYYIPPFELLKHDLPAVELRYWVRNLAERKLAEEELRESEEKYRSLFDNMLDGFAYCKIVVDEDNQPVDFVYLEVNDAFERLTGLRREDVIDRKVTEAIPGIREAHPELFSIYGNVALTGAPAKFDIYFEPLEIWLTISVYSPHKGYFVAVFENITERKRAEEELKKHRDHLEELVKERTAELETVNEELQREISERREAEQALRESEEKLRTLFQSTREAIVTSGPDGRIFSANPAAAAMLGYDSPEELVGRPTSEFYTDPEQRTALLQELMQKGHAENWELTFRKKDGTQVHVLFVGTIHRDREGNILRTDGMFMDVTERKQAEELFRTLATSSQTAIYIIQDGKFRYVNPQFQRCTGYSEEELLGTDSLMLVLPEDRAIVRGSAVKILQGELSSTCEFRALNKNGEIRYAMEVVTSIQYQGKRAILGNYIDITERVEMQEKLLVSERLATLGELSGSISHELRNPLGVIDSSAYYLQKRLKGADVKVQQHLDRIRSSVDSAVAIIESLLNLTRMEAPQAERLNLIAIASDAIVISEVPATVDVIQDFAEHEVWVNVDREQLNMAFQNIVTNAVQAMEGKGTLTVTAHTTDGQAEISFADTGPGIAAENLDRVFEPLFSTKAKGIGFGLSIVKMIIDKHGGTIEARSDLGKGTIITMRLPLYADKDEEG